MSDIHAENSTYPTYYGVAEPPARLKLSHWSGGESHPFERLLIKHQLIANSFAFAHRFFSVNEDRIGIVHNPIKKCVCQGAFTNFSMLPGRRKFELNIVD